MITPIRIIRFFQPNLRNNREQIGYVQQPSRTGEDSAIVPLNIDLQKNWTIVDEPCVQCRYWAFLAFCQSSWLRPKRSDWLYLDPQ